ncbi:hypothetical protein, partial [Streptomyces violascens]|uniref:hypothetical protein n=1 Tax=Streptomyces violascens TaxID=67381 RepID=UPI0036ABAF02
GTQHTLGAPVQRVGLPHGGGSCAAPAAESAAGAGRPSPRAPHGSTRAATPLSWQETADGIEKAARLLDEAALSLRPVAGMYLDASDLTATVEETAREVREASTLLTEVYGDGGHLVDHTLVPRFVPDPDQLRLARQEGERAALVAALARRPVPHDGEAVWSAAWRADGTVRAGRLGPRRCPTSCSRSRTMAARPGRPRR